MSPNTAPCNDVILERALSRSPGDHFPDHMKFTDFSSRGKQRLPGIKCLPIWSTVVVSY